MTIQNENNKIIYTGDGVATVYPYNFRVDNESDFDVTVNGITLEYGTDYTADNLGDGNGGNITFAVPPGLDLSVIIMRIVTILQGADYQPYDPFPAEIHELALDKLTMICQQLEEKSERAITSPPDDGGDINYSLPKYDSGKALMWSEDVQDKKLVNSDDIINGIIASASGSASAADISAVLAKASEDKAEKWSQEDEDVEVDPNLFSAFHWAMKASQWAGGMPQGTIMVFNQVEVLSTWTIIDTGDCLIAVSNGTDKLYNGAVSGDLEIGNWVKGGLSVSINNHVLLTSQIPAHGHPYYATFDTGNLAGQDGVSAGYGVASSQLQDTGVNTPAGSGHSHGGSVSDNGSGRPLAAVCHLAIKD